jgi:hypothetical protein
LAKGIVSIVCIKHSWKVTTILWFSGISLLSKFMAFKLLFVSVDAKNVVFLNNSYLMQIICILSVILCMSCKYIGTMNNVSRTKEWQTLEMIFLLLSLFFIYLMYGAQIIKILVILIVILTVGTLAYNQGWWLYF